MARKRRKTPRHSRRKQTPVALKMATILTPIAVIGLGAYALSSTMRIEQMGADYCYARSDQHKEGIFIDNSIQDLSEDQQRDYRQTIQMVYDRAPANAHIQIYSTMTDRSSSLGDLTVSLCKPAATTADQESIGAPVKTGPWHARTAQKARATFEAEVDRLLDEVASQDKLAGDSPILEQLQAISIRPEFTGENRKLTVISDLLQNSETARFCSAKGHMPSFKTFTKRSAYRFVKPKGFDGVQVTLAYVDQNVSLPHCTKPELVKWYEDYFTENGAETVTVSRLRSWVKRS